MGRNFHHRGCGTAVGHVAQDAEEVGGLGRRTQPAGGALEVGPLAKVVAQGTDPSRGDAGGGEQSADQVNHRRLAVGAGDPDDE